VQFDLGTGMAYNNFGGPIVGVDQFSNIEVFKGGSVRGRGPVEQKVGKRSLADFAVHSVSFPVSGCHQVLLALTFFGLKPLTRWLPVRRKD